jgi:hypothetical protein
MSRLVRDLPTAMSVNSEAAVASGPGIGVHLLQSGTFPRRAGGLIAVGAANSDGDHCEHDTHPDRWLDADELIYMINTVITPVPR